MWYAIGVPFLISLFLVTLVVCGFTAAFRAAEKFYCIPQQPKDAGASSE